MSDGGFLEGFVKVTRENIDRMKATNSGIRGMDYFYEFAKNLFSSRLKEIESERRRGKKFLGTFCNFVPLELVHAAGAVPIRVCAGYENTVIPAEEVLPRSSCPLIKSSLGFAMKNLPFIDQMDVLVVPMTCDGKKKMCEHLSEFKPTWGIEVPHTVLTPQARELWLSEIRLFKEHMEKLTKRKITTTNLMEAIENSNAQRRLVRRLYKTRTKKEVPIWGRDALLVTNSFFYDNSNRWSNMTEKLCRELEGREGVFNDDRPRLLLTGSPILMPSWKLPIAIEEAGGVIVCDELCTGSKGLWDPVQVGTLTLGNMLDAIVDRYLMNNCACFSPNTARVDRILQFSKEFHVEGVVYHLLQACQPYAMEASLIEKILKKNNIPMLTIETDYSSGDVGRIKTRIEAFIEMLNDRKGNL